MHLAEGESQRLASLTFGRILENTPMALRRKQSVIFDAAPEKVLEAIHSSLSETHANYRYENTIEADNRLAFFTVVRPSQWLFWRARLTVAVKPGLESTKVMVEARWPGCVLADAWDFLGGYTHDFLESVERKLGLSREPGTPTETQFSSRHDYLERGRSFAQAPLGPHSSGITVAGIVGIFVVLLGTIPGMRSCFLLQQ
jgi:hypothetical protein